MQRIWLLCLVSVLFIGQRTAFALELVIGEEKVAPGIVFVFEGAIKDHIEPEMLHMSESDTDVHIEARVNWADADIPEGTPAGGFVPYLGITAKVVNEKTGLSTFIDLLPHINLIDNFHYARNIQLPGEKTDPYTVTFNVVPPFMNELALHKDWLDNYGSTLLEPQTFTYRNVDFEEIANANRH